MKITPKQIMAALKKSHGYTGKANAADVKAFIEEKDMGTLTVNGEPIDIDAVFAKKTVNITIEADAGEDTKVNGESIADEAQEQVEAEAPAPSKRAPVGQAVKDFYSLQNATFGIGQSKASHKAYNAKAKLGKSLFPDADIAEAAGAWVRLKSFRNLQDGYTQKANDIAIVKATIGTNNVLGGNTVPPEFANFMIENVAKYGAFRRVVGETPMSREQMYVPTLDSDVTMTFVGQNVAGTSTEPNFGQAELVARKMMGIDVISNEILEDSAINIADKIHESFSRAMAKADDQNGFLGDENGTYGPFVGLANAIGSAGLISASGNAWSAVVEGDIWKARAAISPRFSGRRVAITCSEAAYWQVLHPMLRVKAMSMTEARAGLASIGAEDADAFFDGMPVYWSPALPSTSASASKFLYIGDFKGACKFGQRTGALAIEPSDQRYWDQDAVGIRGKNRIAINCHDVGNDSVTGGVVALVTT